MELAFILVYAAILGLVAPYLGIDLKLIGSLVPGAIALVLIPCRPHSRAMACVIWISAALLMP